MKQPNELADDLARLGVVAQFADRRNGVALIALRTGSVPTNDDGGGIQIVDGEPIPEDLEPHLAPDDFREMPRAEIERSFAAIERDARRLLEHGDADAESLEILRIQLAFATEFVRRDA